MRIGLDQQERPVVSFVCADGSRAELGDLGGPVGGPRLKFLDPRGDERVDLYAANGPWPSTGLLILDSNGLRIDLAHDTSSESAHLVMYRARGSVPGAYLGVDDHGGVGLQLIDSKGKHLLDVPPER